MYPMLTWLSLSMHEVLTYRTNEYSSMSPRSKSFIKWLRHGQSVLRVLQLVAALGLLTLMILIDKVPTIEGWIMRITVSSSLSTPNWSST